MLKEFKQFALRGNVMDLAVGVIIGGAFGLIVNSAVNDLILPLIGIVYKSDFSNLYLPLTKDVSAAMEVDPKLTLEAARKIGPVFAWGNFITIVFNFIILAFIVFWMVKFVNKMRIKEEAKPAAPPEIPADVKLLTEIRDILGKK